MRALAVMPHEHEDLRRPADAVHPVRRPCAELRHLARRQHEVLVTEEEAEPTAEDGKPVVSLVRSGLGSPALGQRQVVRAWAASALAAERHHAHAVDRAGPAAHARVVPRFGRQQRVSGGPERTGQRREVIDGQSPLAGLEPAERRPRHPGRPRDGVERQPALLAQRAEPPSNALLFRCQISKGSRHTEQRSATVYRMDTDVVVVGGGSAGLQAALTLGRMRFDVVVVDAGEPSNAPAHAIGGLLGARDTGPLDLLATGRAQLAELPSVRLIDGEATLVDAAGPVTLADGTELAARAV